MSLHLSLLVLYGYRTLQPHDSTPSHLCVHPMFFKSLHHVVHEHSYGRRLLDSYEPSKLAINIWAIYQPPQLASYSLVCTRNLKLTLIFQFESRNERCFARDHVIGIRCLFSLALCQTIVYGCAQCVYKLTPLIHSVHVTPTTICLPCCFVNCDPNWVCQIDHQLSFRN